MKRSSSTKSGWNNIKRIDNTDLYCTLQCTYSK